MLLRLIPISNIMLTAFVLMSNNVFGQNMINELKTKNEIISIAKGYFGGYQIEEPQCKGKPLLIVIGMPTSGIATSEILVYQKSSTDLFQLISYRNTLWGTAKIEDDDIELNITIDGTKILSFSCDSLSIERVPVR